MKSLQFTLDIVALTTLATLLMLVSPLLLALASFGGFLTLAWRLETQRN